MSGRTCRTRLSNTQVRSVTSSVHPGRTCLPCALCNTSNLSKYFHPKDKTLFENLRKCEPSIDVQPDSCICRLCRDDVSKISDENFIPRWKRLRNVDNDTCYVHGCKNAVHKVTKVATRTQVCDFFKLPAGNTNESIGTPLCVEHYGAMYRHLNPMQNKCRTCEQAITDMKKSRTCPRPVLVQTFLQQNTEFIGTINPQDRVCYACYKSHLVIIKHTQKNITSTDVDLSTQIKRIKSEMSSLSDIHTLDQAITHAVHLSAVYVGEHLLKQTALLLPDVCDIFNDYVTETIGLCGIEHDENIKSVAKPSWVRSQLSSLLEHHLAYRCPVKKCGTVLYRHGGDLVHALSISLSQTREQLSRTSTKEKNDSDKFQLNLASLCTTINNKLHTCIDTLLQEDATHPHSIENINVDEFISKLDPDIWKAICLITQARTSQASKGDISRIRKIRRVFCTCALMFTTNNKCSFPLHTLITDAIETCGGSSRLVKMLNRLGVCVSPDTHARYVQYRIKKKLQRRDL